MSDEQRDDAGTYELLALFDRDDDDAVETIRQRCLRSPQDREVVAAAALVERLLGPAGDAHPRTAELLAYVDDDLGQAARAGIALHLSSCPGCQELVEAARCGLDEAIQIERGLQWLAAGKPAVVDAMTSAPTLPLAVTRPPALALAATAAPPPLPRERHLLLSEESHQLVYLQRAGKAQLGLFSDRRGELQISVTLDSRELAAAIDDDGAVLFDLGPVAMLFGQRLEVALGGLARGCWRWTFIEAPDEAA